MGRPLVRLAAVHSLLVLAWLAWLLTVRHAVEKSEPLLCNLAWQWHRGVFPFTPLRGFPVFVNPYGPIYTWLNHLLPWPAGQPYLMGRLVSLVCTLGVAGLLGVLAARRTGQRRLGWLAAALYLTARPAIEYGAIYRIDLLTLFFTVAGFALAVSTGRQAGRPGRAGLGLAALLFALAVHTKSSALAAPLALSVWLWREDRRRAVGFAACWIALSGLGLACLEWRTNGVYLDHNELLALQWSRPFDMLARPFGTSPLWIIAFAVGCGWLTRADRGALAAERLWLCWSLAICAATAVNRGGSWNYLLEPYAAFALLTVGVLGRCRPPVRSARLLPRLLLAHFVVSLLYTGLLLQAQNAGLNRYAPRVAAAIKRLQPLVATGQRIAVTAAEPDKDALLLLGAGTPIDLMWPQQSLARQLADAALKSGQITRIIDRVDRW